MDVVEEQAFLVKQTGFNGSLTELAYSLRQQTISPQNINILELVKDYLNYFDKFAQNDLNLASEALPMVARVLELKLRFLLPRPEIDDEEEEIILEETLEVIGLLEELSDAISFLRQRRIDRRLLIPAKTSRPSYPRLERPINIGLNRLAQLASRYSFGSYFELAIERLTMASAMKILIRNLKRFKKAKLVELIEHQSWAVLTISFVAALELFKENKIDLRQETSFGDIELEIIQKENIEAA